MAAPLLVSDASASEIPEAARKADVVFLGEQHDNPAHHAVQARWVAELKPTVLVFEMLTEEQASNVTEENRLDETLLGDSLDWENSGWPDFGMYFPIFMAAPDAMILGAAVPREQLIRSMKEGAKDVLDAEQSERFGLLTPLPADQLEQRISLQRDAHCDALPEDLLPGMVEVQRLRDAVLARAAAQGIDDFGGPVVVITGNGHARDDWGAPFLLRQAAPDLDVFTLGQGESGRAPDGGFGFVLDGPSVDRGDPCDAFK